MKSKKIKLKKASSISKYVEYITPNSKTDDENVDFADLEVYNILQNNIKNNDNIFIYYDL